LLSGNPQDQILFVGDHKLAQVRLIEQDGPTIILAQYLDYMESVLHAQLVSRCLTTAVTALAIMLLIYLGMRFWVIAPVTSLAHTARQWAARDFSARSKLTGPAEFRFLADELNSMSQQLERHQNNLTAELEQARQIQTNLLPTGQPVISGLHIVADYRPAQHVAGDLYDVFNASQNRTCITILDVSGHGISAALLTGVVKMSLRRRLLEEDDLSKAMRLVNEDLLACTPEGHFVTACVGLWSQRDQTWMYCAAGHPGGLWLTQGYTAVLESTAPLLGVLEETSWPIKTVKLSSGDRVFLYTDGIVESGLAQGKVKDYDLQEVVHHCLHQGLNEQVATIMAGAVERSCGHMKDDATIIAFEVLP
jgi:serine phosphatase RsbU (regulator of sigma subunit)